MTRAVRRLALLGPWVVLAGTLAMAAPPSPEPGAAQKSPATTKASGGSSASKPSATGTAPGTGGGTSSGKASSAARPAGALDGGHAPAAPTDGRTAASGDGAAGAWRSLAPGVEYGTFTLESAPDEGDGLAHVVRIDTTKATLDFALASETKDGEPRRCGEWTDQHGFVAAINAGMYGTDLRTNVGYLRHGAHENNGRWKGTYQSVLVFGPRAKGLPPAALVDRDTLDAKAFEEQVKQYENVVQNLRLVKGAGENVWKPNAREWSEAMVGVDGQGRVLFLFSRTPFEMVELNTRVLKLPLGLVRAMHVEGGPEASLSVRAPGLSLDLAGGYVSSIFERGDDARQWRIPNVLGVRKR